MSSSGGIREEGKGVTIYPDMEHTVAVNGALQPEELPGLTVHGSGKELERLDLRLNGGTSLEVELKRIVKGEGAAETITKIKVSKGTPVYEPFALALNDKDYLFLVMSAPVGEPQKLSYTFSVKQTK